MKVLSLDFDFTLRHSDGSLSPILVEAMATAKKHKVPVYITTNRSIKESLLRIQNFIEPELKALFSNPNKEGAKKNIIKKISSLCFGNALDEITKLGLPTPIISTKYDLLLDKNQDKPYYQNIDQVLEILIKEAEKLDDNENSIREFSEKIKKMINFISNDEETQENNDNEVKEEPSTSHDNSSPTLEGIDEGLRNLIIQENNLNTKKPNKDKSLQLVRIASELKEKEIHFIHVDDSQEIIKGFGKEDMLDFKQVTNEIKHELPDVTIRVSPVPYAEKEVMKIVKVQNQRSKIEKTPTDQFHDKILDSIETYICPTKSKTIPVLSIDLDGTLFNTDKYQARITPELLPLMYFAQGSGIPLFINTNRTVAESYNQMNKQGHITENQDTAFVHMKNHSLTEPLSQLSAHGITPKVVTPGDAFGESKEPYSNTILAAEKEVFDHFQDPQVSDGEVSVYFHNRKQSGDGYYAIENKTMKSKKPQIGEKWKRPQFSKIVDTLEETYSDTNFELLHIDDRKIENDKRIHNHKITTYFFNVEHASGEANIADAYKTVMIDAADKIGLKNYAEKILINYLDESKEQNPFKEENFLKDLSTIHYLLLTPPKGIQILNLMDKFYDIHGETLNNAQKEALDYAEKIYSAEYPLRLMKEEEYEKLIEKSSTHLNLETILLLLQKSPPESDKKLKELIESFIDKKGTELYQQYKIQSLFDEIKIRFGIKESHQLFHKIRVNSLEIYAKKIIYASNNLYKFDQEQTLSLLNSINYLYKKIDLLKTYDVTEIFNAHLNIILSLHAKGELKPDLLAGFASRIYPSLGENEKNKFLNIIQNEEIFYSGFYEESDESLNHNGRSSMSSSELNTNLKSSNEYQEITEELDKQANEHKSLIQSDSFFPSDISSFFNTNSFDSNTSQHSSDYKKLPIYLSEPWDDISKARVKGIHFNESKSFEIFKDFINDSDYWKSKHKGLSFKCTQIPGGIQTLQNQIRNANGCINFGDLKIGITTYCENEGNYKFFAQRRDQSSTQPFYTLLKTSHSYEEVLRSQEFQTLLKDRENFYRERLENSKTLYINPGLH